MNLKIVFLLSLSVYFIFHSFIDSLISDIYKQSERSFLQSPPHDLRKESSLSSPLSATIFCIILTEKQNLKRKIAHTTYATWAHKCDNFTFVTKLKRKRSRKTPFDTDAHVSTREYQELHLLDPPGLVEDTYWELTNKVYLAFKYLYTNIGRKYDWYLKTDDDTFVFVDNLRSFLSSKNSSQPVTYGYDYSTNVEYGFHSGGAGYVLSAEAFERIGRFLQTNYSSCSNIGMEDLDVAFCLRQLDVYPAKSLDEQGRERFHPLSIWDHYNGLYPQWFLNASSNAVKKVCELQAISTSSIQLVK